MPRSVTSRISLPVVQRLTLYVIEEGLVRVHDDELAKRKLERLALALADGAAQLDDTLQQVSRSKGEGDSEE